MTTATPVITNYNHLITTRPHDVRRVFISDLHLSAEEPALVQAFLALLDDLLALPNLIELYILGDWFDAWVGDDAYLSLTDAQKQPHWLTPIINKLSELKQAGCHTLVMHGNRDFLIGQAFCDCFGGQLIREPFQLSLGTETYRLEHGDALCTDDVSYQRFRRITRHRGVQWLFLKQPLSKRLSVAQKLRQHSSEDKAHKPMAIMDVNPQAVAQALTEVDHLLHGHTHRAAIHDSSLLLLTSKATKWSKSKAINKLSNFKLSNLRLSSNRLSNNRLSSNKHKRNQQHSNFNSNKQVTAQYRYVLGDWQVINRHSSSQHVEAVIAMTTVDDDCPNQGSSYTSQISNKNTNSQSSENKSAQNRQSPNERLQLVSFLV